jgi:CheY-like chemotaxis protein
MDVQMPEMDGIQTTKQIVKKYAHWHPDIQLPHIIALTAAAMDGDRDRCINAGMVDYITKPFRADHVFDTLGKWMERRETPPDPNLLDKVVSSSRDTVASSKATSDERGININSNGNDNGKDYRVTDINKLYDYARGNEQVVANMVDVFLEHTPDYINNLRKQVERGAWKAVKKQAHKMKPQMGYVGLDRVVILLERVEEEALERQRADQVKALLRKVEELCDQAMEELVLWRDKQELAADS